MKNIKISLTSQASIEKKLLNKAFSGSNYDKKDITFINIFLGLRKKYPIIIPSHELIAKMAKCCISTVQRHLDGLREEGSVKWYQRWRNDCYPVPNLSNLYILNPIFDDIEFQRKAFHIYKNMRLNVAALIISISSLQPENDRRYIKEDIYINKTSAFYERVYSKSGTGIFHAAKITRYKPPDSIQEVNMKINKQSGPPLPIVKAQSPVAFKKELPKWERPHDFQVYSQYQLGLLIDAAKGGVEASQKILDAKGINWRGDGIVRDEIKKDSQQQPEIAKITTLDVIAQYKADIPVKESSAQIPNVSQDINDDVPYTNHNEFGEQLWEEI